MSDTPSPSATPTGKRAAAPGMVPAVIALVVVVLLIIGVGGYMVWGGSGSGSGAADAGAGAGAGNAPNGGAAAGAGDSGKQGLSFLARRDEGDPMALGPVDAPVVLINYSDWRCPFCGKFARDMESAIIRDYVDAGKVRIEWRDMPIFGDESMIGARAGRAAAEQGKYVEFHEVVYAAAPERGHADLNEGTLMAFAEQAGIPDLEKFRDDMLSDRFDEVIRKDAEEGAMYGVNSTPTFIVGKGAIVGAQPLETFVEAIESQLPAGAGE